MSVAEEKSKGCCRFRKRETDCAGGARLLIPPQVHGDDGCWDGMLATVVSGRIPISFRGKKTEVL